MHMEIYENQISAPWDLHGPDDNTGGNGNGGKLKDDAATAMHRPDGCKCFQCIPNGLQQLHSLPHDTYIYIEIYQYIYICIYIYLYILILIFICSYKMLPIYGEGKTRRYGREVSEKEALRIA